MSIKLHFTIPRLGVWWIRTYSEISPTNKKIILDESIDEPLSYNYTVLELWERFNKDKKIDTELWKRLEDVIQYQIRLAKDNLPGAVGYPTGMESPDEARHISTLICIRGGSSGLS